jgi:hypothetical protein
VTNGMIIAGLGTITANGSGQVSATLTSPFKSQVPVPPGAKLEVLDGTGGDSVSTQPIAEASYNGATTYQLTSVESGYGTPRGTATLMYNPAAQTISVTVNASRLTPGAHAAHIHLGTCQSQGAVQYMLMDFTANAQGQIQNQTRTVTGVTTAVPATGWYLNLHQGDRNTILANGQPTIAFRPLLCSNI